MTGTLDKREIVYRVWTEQKVKRWTRIVDTESMRPLLVGEVYAFIQWGKVLNIQSGDLALFKTAGFQVLHRVVSVDNDGRFLQMADNFSPGYSVTGGWIDRGDILGIVELLKWYKGQNQCIVDLQQNRNRRISQFVAQFLRLQWNLSMKPDAIRAHDKSQLDKTWRKISFSVSRILSRVIFHILRLFLVRRFEVRDDDN